MRLAAGDLRPPRASPTPSLPRRGRRLHSLAVRPTPECRSQHNPVPVTRFALRALRSHTIAWIHRPALPPTRKGSPDCSASSRLTRVVRHLVSRPRTLRWKHALQLPIFLERRGLDRERAPIPALQPTFQACLLAPRTEKPPATRLENQHPPATGFRPRMSIAHARNTPSQSAGDCSSWRRLSLVRRPRSTRSLIVLRP